MKVSTSLLQHPIELSDEQVASVVIENGRLFREMVQDLCDCIEHGDGDAILSEDGVELKFADSVDMIKEFVPFRLNTKILVTALMKRLEKYALSADRRDATNELVESVRSYVRGLTLEIPYEVECEGLTMSAIIKGCAPSFTEEEGGLEDKILAYMRLVREFSGERIFILVNMRSYFTDQESLKLLETCLAEHFVMLMIEGCARPLLPMELRLLVDSDLCEITQRDDLML